MNTRIPIAVMLAAAAMGAQAQTYPTKPVRLIVPFPPGGGTDLISRAIAPKLSEAWGQQIVVDNRPGSGGTIGMAIAAKTPPDGYTAVMGQLANLSAAPSMYKNLPYDPVRDFAPVTQVVSTPLVLVSHPSLPAKNVKELVALARAKPDALTYGSPGNGTLGHLAAEMFKTMTGTKMLHIPYKGASLAITELMGGQITTYFSSIPPAVSLIKAGRLKALGVTSLKRATALPDIPSIAEGGVPGYDAVNWYGLAYPAGTPQAIVAKMHEDTVKILRLPEVRDRFSSEAGEVVGNTPEQFAAFIKTEAVKWGKVIRDSGARVD